MSTLSYVYYVMIPTLKGSQIYLQGGQSIASKKRKILSHKNAWTKHIIYVVIKNN